MDQPLFQTLTNCRLSGEPIQDEEPIVTFHSVPIPGLFFKNAGEADKMRMPLTLIKSQSGLIQLKEILSETVYEHYLMRPADAAHLNWIEFVVDEMYNSFPLSADILEVGGGQGHLMNALEKRGFSRLTNLDPAAKKVGKKAKFISGYFPATLDNQNWNAQYDCIVAQHLLEHLPQPLEFMKGASKYLKPDGELWIEIPDIESAETDGYGQLGFIYPLHQSYFTKKTLQKLGQKAGLCLKKIELVPHYGKSLWAKFSRKKADAIEVPEESPLLVSTIKAYFQELNTFANALPKELICWGAAERPLSIFAQLSYSGIKATAIFDSNPHIHSLYPAGLNVPVLSPKDFPQNPAHLLILSPAFHAEILKGIWFRIGPETLIHIPLVGQFTRDNYPFFLDLTFDKETK